MKLISIIVPVYNAENNIENCIHSILNQTYSNLEIILINDGSTDHSLEVLNTLAKKDSRIKVLSQENKGVSAARNKGLEHATGDKICFVDIDDMLQETTIQELYFSCDNADLIITNYNTKTKSKVIENNLKKNGNYNKKEILTMLIELYNEGFLNPLWNKLFSKSLIVKYNLRLDESLNMGEDLVFVLDYISKVETVKLENINNPYDYIVDSNEQSLTKLLDFKYFEMYSKITDYLSEFLAKESTLSNNQAKKIHYNYTVSIISFILKYFSKHTEIKKSEIIELYNHIDFNKININQLNFKYKCVWIVFKSKNSYLIKLFFYFYKKIYVNK